MAAHFIRLVDIAVVQKRVCSTATAAIVFCPAFSARFLGPHITALKSGLFFRIKGAGADIAKQPLGNTDELVAGVDIAIGRDRSIFGACAAAGDALAQTGSPLHIDHEMEEIEPTPVLALMQIIICQLIILSKNALQMRFQNAVWTFCGQDNRLQGKLAETFIQQGLYILRKIQIVSGEGTADVMLLVSAIRYKPLCLLENHIVRTLAVDRGTERIMDFFAPIQADDDIVHLPVDEIDAFVVQRNAVCGHGKVDLLTEPLFLLAAICDDLLANIKVHERLAAKEIDLQMLSGTAAFHQKIDGSLSDGERHQHARTVKIAGGSKAVFTAQVAIMRNMQAERFDRAAAAHLGRFLLLAIDQPLLL